MMKTVKAVIGYMIKNPVLMIVVLAYPALKLFFYMFGAALTENGAAYFLTATMGVLMLFAAVRAAMYFKFFSQAVYVNKIKEDALALAILLGSIFIGLAMVIGCILGG